MKRINQCANFALLEWPENLEISDSPPESYVPLMRQRFGDEEWRVMSEFHALPEGWEAMEYEEFLAARRRLMSGIIQRGFQSLQ